MDRGNERLTSKAIEQWLKSPDRKAGQKLADGGGLYLTSLPSGGASWQVRYAHGGKQGTYSIGPHGSVSLTDARKRRAQIKQQVAGGVDPVTERRAVRAEGEAASEVTFGDLAKAWLEKQRGDWSEVHFAKSKRALDRDVVPTLGKLPVARITTAMVAGVIDRIQKRGVRETAQKILQHVRSVFRYAQAKGLRLDNPADPVQEILERAPEVKSHPALLSFSELGDVLRRADTSKISPGVRLAHRLIAFTAVRVSNAVGARWAHFDLDASPAVWTIPRDEMKVSGQGRSHAHRVVLPEPLVRDLKRWRQAQPGDAVFLFPGNQGREHISREAVEKALRETLGLADKHSPHGWRSAFSTRAREDTDFDKELIDLALDHVHASDVARAYDRGQRLEKRIELMRWWGASLERAEMRTDAVQG
jgi:integrase